MYADHAGAKRAYLLSGIAAWASPLLFVAWADGFWSALWLHALTGLCQGGLYTPVLELVAAYSAAQWDAVSALAGALGRVKVVTKSGKTVDLEALRPQAPATDAATESTGDSESTES